MSDLAKKKFTQLLENNKGNFAIMAALTVPVVFIAASLAVDTTNAMSMKIRLQNAVDSAALATSTRLAQEEGLSLDDAKAFAVSFLNGQIEEDMPAFTDLNVKPTVNITTAEEDGATVWRVAITTVGTQTLTPMARLMGRETISLDVFGQSESASGKTQGAFSMALVLDRSGSMDWNLDGQRKIDVLKAAVGGLLDQIETADPAHNYVRIGASSYNTRMTGSQKLHWKPKKTRDFVNALPADGGTDSTEAFGWAYESVTAAKEAKQHQARNETGAAALHRLHDRWRQQLQLRRLLHQDPLQGGKGSRRSGLHGGICRTDPGQAASVLLRQQFGAFLRCPEQRRSDRRFQEHRRADVAGCFTPHALIHSPESTVVRMVGRDMRGQPCGAIFFSVCTT
jgi:Flp pilus assembly protein TadG